MKKNIWAALVLLISAGSFCFGAPIRFEKLSDHCYYLPLKEQDNVTAVVTDEGILVIDPPAESALAGTLDALKRLSAKPVRWVAFTNLRFSRNAGARYFAERGAALLASSQFRALSIKTAGTEEIRASFPWFYFDRQMHLFPSGLEIRIIAVQSKARSGGDVAIYVPAEKVLFTGALYEAARYPEIDAESEGNALGWIDGMKQVIASVPLLKAAIPPKQAKSAAKPEPEKTLEESVIVLAARGGASNLQNMKDVLEAAQKLQSELSRRIKTGRVCEDFMISPAAIPFQSFGNLDGYVAQLCAALNSQAGSDNSSAPPAPSR
jgi:glyoxylase-like metal-dependent hydrolase (beta-lactamase superfamily II)